ncbi:MAG: hypothetical protein ACM3MG_05315 [Bacillota bacterium]
MRYILLVFTVLNLAACAFDKDNSGSDKQTRRLAEQNAEVIANFSKAKGLYAGDLTRPNGVEKIQINLSILGESGSSANNDGTTDVRYRQAAAYIRINPVGQTITSFAVNFIPETGVLSLVNTAKDIGIDDVHSIFATIINGRLTGSVNSLTGQIGLINLQIQANESANPSNGAEEEYNNRLRQQYNAIAGSYVGCVKPPPNSDTQSYTVTMNLSVYEDATDGSAKTTTPRLAGSFHRDYDKLGGLDASLSATYRPDLHPATLNIVGKPFVSNNGYVSTFQGTIIDGDYEGTFTSTRKGLEGNIYMKKGKTLPAKCSSKSGLKVKRQ